VGEVRADETTFAVIDDLLDSDTNTTSSADYHQSGDDSAYGNHILQI
jgi:hypothetical protein